METKEIQIPVFMLEQIGKVDRTARQLAGELGREPTDKEIAERMDWPLKRVQGLQAIARDVERKLQEARQAYSK